MSAMTLDWNKYKQAAIDIACEGAVLLKNDREALPASKDSKIALFGRMQANYYKSGTEYPYKGRITSMTGTVDRTTGALTCKATFPNPNGVLYSGIQGTVVIPFDVKDVIVVPQNAIVRLQNKSLAYKVGPDSCAYSTIVKTAGIGSDRNLVVMSGLEVGDVIVTEGANNLVEGQRVLF